MISKLRRPGTGPRAAACDPRPAPPAPAKTVSRLSAALAIAAVALLAFVHVPYPFDDDQGLFAYGARAIAHGAHLYLDFWDLKQPAIYWYYAVAGSIFGFDEVGIHVFDLLWMCGLAIVLLRIGMRAFRAPLLAAVTPLLCLAPFYAKAEPIHLAQVEIVAVLPIASVLLLLLRAAPAAPATAWRYAAAGALTVSVMAFKIVLAPIPALLILVSLLHATLNGRGTLRDALLRGVLPAAAGAVAAAIPLLAYLWHAGILGPALWVAFVYPRLALAEYPWQPLATLADSAAWFWSAERFVLPFALVGLWSEIVMRRSLLGRLALAWLVVGCLVLLIQVLSWWQYHFDLFFVPLGLLAVAGIATLGELLARRPGARWFPAAACSALLLTVAVSIVHKVQRYWLAGASPFSDPMAFMIRVEPRMRAIADGAAFLAAPGARPGTIANLGDPRMFLYANRPAILAVNGSGYMLAGQWRDAAALLERERPVYIYLGDDTRFVWSHAGDAIGKLVATRYVLRRRDGRRGEWHELRAAGPSALAGSRGPP